jgi:hypothetical protein
MGTCKQCLKRKPSTEFYASIPTYCKSCWKARVKANREANSEHYRAYEKDRAMAEHRIAARKAYSESERGKAVEAEIKRNWQKRNAEKRAAHVILGNAVRDGRIEKPSNCQRCRMSTVSRRLHAHHDDYAKPLDVEWLCAKCHREEHA